MPNYVQLTLWDMQTIPSRRSLPQEEWDSMFMWRTAIAAFDHKRWKNGWRPWHKAKKGE